MGEGTQRRSSCHPARVKQQIALDPFQKTKKLRNYNSALAASCHAVSISRQSLRQELRNTRDTVSSSKYQVPDLWYTVLPIPPPTHTHTTHEPIKSQMKSSTSPCTVGPQYFDIVLYLTPTIRKNYIIDSPRGRRFS